MFQNLLRRPYYLEDDDKKNWRKVLLISGFVFFFLYVFQPFQIDEYLGNTFLLVLGYAGVTFVVTALFVVILPKIFTDFFSTEKWTTQKEILQILSMVLVIGLINALYSAQFGIIGSFYTGLLYFEFYTFSVAVIPVVFLVLFTEKKDATKHDHLSEEIMQRGIVHQDQTISASPLIQLTAQNGKDKVALHPQHILYLKSDANYVEIFHSADDEKIEKELLRNTLSEMENQLKDQGRFFRCHKSYIINLAQVERISGNAQGLKIHLPRQEEVIPVSRKNNAILKKLLAVEK
ncbi:MAG: LytTR family DNA-binding domain-containing protein [Bacteroidota bacterium]